MASRQNNLVSLFGGLEEKEAPLQSLPPWPVIRPGENFWGTVQFGMYLAYDLLKTHLRHSYNLLVIVMVAGLAMVWSLAR